MLTNKRRLFLCSRRFSGTFPVSSSWSGGKKTLELPVQIRRRSFIGRKAVKQRLQKQRFPVRLPVFKGKSNERFVYWSSTSIMEVICNGLDLCLGMYSHVVVVDNNLPVPASIWHIHTDLFFGISLTGKVCRVIVLPPVGGGVDVSNGGTDLPGPPRAVFTSRCA